MNTKVLATLLVLGMASTLGACGGGEADPAASPSASPSPAMSSPAMSSPAPSASKKP
jgi:hypothetical protein